MTGSNREISNTAGSLKLKKGVSTHMPRHTEKKMFDQVELGLSSRVLGFQTSKEDFFSLELG